MALGKLYDHNLAINLDEMVKEDAAPKSELSKRSHDNLHANNQSDERTDSADAFEAGKSPVFQPLSPKGKPGTLLSYYSRMKKGSSAFQPLSSKGKPGTLHNYFSKKEKKSRSRSSEDEVKKKLKVKEEDKGTLFDFSGFEKKGV